eukprot:g15031.t1
MIHQTLGTKFSTNQSQPSQPSMSEIEPAEHTRQAFEGQDSGDVVVDAPPQYERTSTLQRMTSGIQIISRSATQRLDRANILPHTEHEKHTCCSFRACLLAVWAVFILVVIILLSITLSNRHELQEMKQYQTDAYNLNYDECYFTAPYKESCSDCLRPSDLNKPTICSSWLSQLKQCRNVNCAQLGYAPSNFCDVRKVEQMDPNNPKYVPTPIMIPCCIDRANLANNDTLQTYCAGAANPLVKNGPDHKFPCGGMAESARSYTCPVPPTKPEVPATDCKAIGMGNEFYCCPNTLDPPDNIMGDTCYQPLRRGYAQHCIEDTSTGNIGWCRICTEEPGLPNSCLNLGG